MNAIVIDFLAAQRRLARPLQAPRLAAALVAECMAWWLLPLSIASAAVAGYHQAQRAVLYPGEGRPC